MPGPVDRESFFKAQKRHRRSTWKISLVCILTVLVLGVPLSMVMTPVVLAAAVLGCDLVNIVTTAPDLYFPISETIEKLLSYEDVSTLIRSEGGFLLVFSFSTGSVVFLVVWLAVFRLVRRAGSGIILKTLNARDPDSGDLEERQLVNVVEEMSIAAGIKVPKVMLFDSDSANGAVLGNSEKDAVIVVSRRLLDDRNRDETQGIAAYLVSLLANGDLGLSMIVLSLFLVTGAMLTLLGSSSSRSARHLAAAFFYRGFRKSNRDDTELVQMLLSSNEDIVIDDQETAGCRVRGRLGLVRQIVQLPFLVLYGTFWIVKTTIMTIVTGPALSWLWRTRCYLADSTAVQLTRNPDGLAAALAEMVPGRAAVAGSGYLDHLFVVGSGSAGRKKQKFFQEAPGRSDGKRDSENRKQQRLEGYRNDLSERHNRERVSNMQGQGLGMVLSMRPPLEKRLEKLHRLGSVFAGEPDKKKFLPESPQMRLVLVLFCLFLLPMAVLALMCVYAVVLIATTLGLGAGMLLLMAVLSFLHPLLRMI